MSRPAHRIKCNLLLQYFFKGEGNRIFRREFSACIVRGPFLQILALTYVFSLAGFMRNVSEPRRKSTYFSRLRWNSLFAVGRTCFARIKNKQFRMVRLNETAERSSWLLLEQRRNAIFLKELLPILLDF